MNYKKIFGCFLCVLALTPLTGCTFIDKLIEEFLDAGGLSARNEYIITCVDLKVVKRDGIAISSSLAPQLRQGVSDGIGAVQNTDKGKNIKLGPQLDGQECPKFYEMVMNNPDVDSPARLKYLQSVCDRLASNMVIWGRYTGDDKEIKVVYFLYRKDLNCFSVSDVLTYQADESERRKLELSSKAIRDLLENSLPVPGEPDHRKISKAVKEISPEETLLSIITRFLF